MEFKKIKGLNQEEIDKFSEFFPTPEVIFVRVNQVPEILTSSIDLQQITLAIHYFSGALCGRGFEIYRDAHDDKILGFPINRDLYKISSGALYKVQNPTDHWLTSVPTVPLVVF